MKRILPLVCMILVCLSPLAAQETNSDGATDTTSADETPAQKETPATSDTPAQGETPAQKESPAEYEYKMTQPGDQFIFISLDGSFPLMFGDLFTETSKLNAGGMGTLGYNYFFTSNFSAGVEAGFGFNITIGSHVFNYIPILATATFQPSFGKFEFPLTMAAGIGIETYIGYKYFPGLVLKPKIGAFYRFTPSWSLGVEASYLFLPQFAALYDSNAHNIMGQFITAGISARYHF